MKKIILIILIFLLMIFFCPTAALAESTENKLSYDLPYLIKWIAQKRGIEVDPQKPLPKLVFLPQEELQRLYEKENGKEDEELIAGFYDHDQIGIYVKDRVKKGETLEEIIVHELVHYFQRFYPSFFSQDFTCLEKKFPYRGCPRQREACKMEKLFRWEHGLAITSFDLECVNP